MDNDLINEIDFNDIKLSPEVKLKLPGRRVLSSRPWSEEQMQVFIERQKHVPDILAKKGIEIVDSIPYEQLKEEWARGDHSSLFPKEK
ncbi:MAG: hypothetical protein U2P59_10300 [Synergistota bacterium]|nr:hypothetical protein [Synergistota bacterium]